MQPTKITSKPELLPGTRNARRGEICFEMDDGHIYTFKTLAKKTGKRAPSLYEQYRRKGWRNFRITHAIQSNKG